MNPLVLARGVSKCFAARTALAGVDLVVPRGELLGLIGPNGAGKSTFLRALVGLVRRDHGELRVHGLDPATDPVLVRQRTSYLPGETSVYQQMTGRALLDFALGFYARRDDELLARMQQGFALPLDKRVRTYSAGMKQKLAVMAALGPDVDLYLLDEPDRALDAQMRYLLRELLRAKKRAGKTIVLSSHHLSEAEALADRLQFVVAGRMVPPAVLDAARTRLARRLRLRLAPGTVLPADAELLQHEADGTVLVHSRVPPLTLLRSLPPEAVLAAELGVLRLDELYQELLHATTAGSNS
ncbi:MAG: ABC transporter ATP-binding protein [Planctomycetes bacterium]|nr:ABC transporter ATP-binding protein [Planctomycetota bacterium]